MAKKRSRGASVGGGGLLQRLKMAGTTRKMRRVRREKKLKNHEAGKRSAAKRKGLAKARDRDEVGTHQSSIVHSLYLRMKEKMREERKVARQARQ